ncbi:hypothetical protein [Nocardioides litoris]|uniref:hypothetical protein n=1 Tax=Nocardioides litoris TaxID=1926648 RepID=UPI00112342B0|nr:hypothetical protein [Nocardioides litoris]
MLVVLGSSVVVLLVALVRLVGARSEASLARRARRRWVHPDAHRLTPGATVELRLAWVAVAVLAAAAVVLTFPRPGPITAGELREELPESFLDGLGGLPTATAARRIELRGDGPRWTLHTVRGQDPGFVSRSQSQQRWQALGTDGRAALCVYLVSVVESDTVDFASTTTGFC